LKTTTYFHAPEGLKSWLTSTDHKKIAWLYLVAITFFFLVGTVAAGLMRIELFTARGDLVSPEIYNRLFSIHGITMVWFFLIPSIPTVLGNFLLPLMLGANDLAYPKLNLLSWYIFVAGGFFTLWAVIDGGVDTGWTFYTPYSTMFSNSHVILAAAGVFITGFSSILTGLNFIVTVHKLRHPDMTWLKLPLFIWSMYATSVILVLATPVLTTALILIALERIFHVGIFNPAMGGDPLLFQHIFWFYSHPAVYIMILPAMGVISEIIPCFTRKRIFGYTFIAFASIAIALFGFLVWGHHMFVSGQSSYANLMFALLSFMVAVPSGIKVFSWTASLYKGKIYLRTPMIYALGFIFLFMIGGLTGLHLASLAIDLHVHDTYFVIGHFHYIMVGGAVMGYLGGIHFWWPKLTGKTYPEKWGRISAVIIIVGFNLTFFPHFILGYEGMLRRYHEYPQHFELLNRISTGGLLLLGFGYFFPIFYLTKSLLKPGRTSGNYWPATGLEWTTTSPPAEENFPELPEKIPAAYAYEDLGDLREE
jgi:cytochrome c oxidase subunit 1